MNDPRHADDELVSAVLDGEATPEQTAAVLGDPARAERLEQFRAVAQAVGEPVRWPDGAADPVAAALARTADDTVAGAGGDPGHSQVSSLDAQRQRSASRSQPRWLTAAAAVLVAFVMVGAAVVWSGSSSDVDMAGSRFDDVGEAIDAPRIASDEAFDEMGDAEGSVAADCMDAEELSPAAGPEADAQDSDATEGAQAPATTMPSPDSADGPVDLGDLGELAGTFAMASLATDIDQRLGAAAPFALDSDSPQLRSLPADLLRCAARLDIEELAGTGTVQLEGRTHTVLVDPTRIWVVELSPCEAILTHRR